MKTVCSVCEALPRVLSLGRTEGQNRSECFSDSGSYICLIMFDPICLILKLAKFQPQLQYDWILVEEIPPQIGNKSRI